MRLSDTTAYNTLSKGSYRFNPTDFLLFFVVFEERRKGDKRGDNSVTNAVLSTTAQPEEGDFL
jgi:hypothetical protein